MTVENVKTKFHKAFKQKKVNIRFAVVGMLLLVLICLTVFAPFYQYFITLPVKAAPVDINPGQNIDSIIQSHPAGTTFLLKAGIHRQQKITQAQNGDTFIGEYIDANNKAVLNGSKVLTGWITDGARWYVTGQTQQGSPQPATDPSGGWQICQNGHRSVCILPEELFFNDVRKVRVLTLAEMGAGEWYFDYNNDRIYVGDNPNSSTVETSVTDRAFNIGASISNITIKNLVIEKYATPAQNATVSVLGPNAIIEYNEIRLNHGNGVQIGNPGSGGWTGYPFPVINSVVRNNYIHKNGFSGIGGAGTNITFEYNEIAENNAAFFQVSWDGGGGKIASSDNAVFRYNYTHDNEGNGLWTDINNINTVYHDNVVINNSKHGIQHEISYTATIRNNDIGYNDGNQIFINNSKNVDIYENNIVIDPSFGNGIIIHNEERGGASTSIDGLKWVVENVDVYNNNTYNGADRGQIGGLQGASSTTTPSANPPSDFATAALTTNFNNNKYYTPSAVSSRWVWGPWVTNRSFSGLQSQGQETGTGSSVTTSGYTLTGKIRTWNYTRGPQASITTGVGVCGDGTIQSPNSSGVAEQCDDSNTNNGDGCSATCQIEQGGGGNLEGWSYRKRFTIQETQIPGTTALTNFPVLISITTDSDLAAKAQSDGDDIVFTASDQLTVIDHELVSYNNATGQLLAWVKVPSVSATLNTDIYMYYGNAAVTSQEDPAGVWSDYKGVWHMEEDPSGTAPQILDSTANNNRGTSAGTMTSGDRVVGKIGNATNFDGTDDRIGMGDPANESLDVTTEDFTLQTWVRTSNTTSMQIISKGAAGNPGYRLYSNGSFSNRPGIALRSTTGVQVDSTPGAYSNDLANGNWHLVTITFDRDGTASVYIDNALKTTLNISSLNGLSLAGTANFTIGRYDAGQYWNGDIDEAKVRNGLLTTDWIVSEYNNQNSPSTFYSIGTEEIVSPTFCGDGSIDTPNTNGVTEICDDGNELNNDSCSSDCLNVCTGGFIWNGTSCINPLGHVIGADFFVLEAENYNLGGQNVAYNDSTTNNIAGAYRNDGVDIKELGNGQYATGYNSTGEWTEFTVNVPVTGIYNLIVRAATGEATGGILAITVDGVPFATVNITSTGSYDTFTLFNQAGGNINSGTRTIRFTVQDQWYDLDYVRFEVPAATCGDNSIDVENNEQCDDGVNNGISCTPSYGGSCTYCSAGCTEITINGSFCGDSTIQSGNGELCDDGSNNGVACTPLYGDSCNYCSNSCTIQTVNGSFCGDNVTNQEDGEACDEGLDNGVACTPGYNTPCDYCSATCEIETVSASYCGDNIIDSGDGELCDNGTQNGITCTPGYGSSCNYCDNSCQTQVVQGGNCGDSITQFGSGEQCDAGANNGNVCTPTYNNSCTYCNNSCINTVVQGIRCGDGIVHSGNGEQCDAGANNDIACTPSYGGSCNYCSSTCLTTTLQGPSCGDGTIQAGNGEQCDNAGNNGVACTAGYGSSCNYCSNSCATQTVTGAYCGDGVTQTSEGEQCDDGNTNNGDSCSNACQIVTPNTTGGGSGGSSSGGSTGTSGTLTRESKPLSTTTAHCGAMDINMDNKFTLADFSIFAQVYGKRCVSNYVSVGSCGSIDSNNDGRITLIDFATFANRFGDQRNCTL